MSWRELAKLPLRDRLLLAYTCVATGAFSGYSFDCLFKYLTTPRQYHCVRCGKYAGPNP